MSLLSLLLLWPCLLLLITLYLLVINEWFSEAHGAHDEFVRWGGVVVVGWWGLHSHFGVQPNYSVEVVLRCGVIGVVTILKHSTRRMGYLVEISLPALLPTSDKASAQYIATIHPTFSYLHSPFSRLSRVQGESMQYGHLSMHHLSWGQMPFIQH